MNESWFLRGDEDTTTREGLIAVVRALNEEAELNKLGKVLASTLLREQLQQRSCVVNEVKNIMSKDEEREYYATLPAPIVVLGVSCVAKDPLVDDH